MNRHTRSGHLETTPAPVGGAGEFAKKIDKIAKKAWHHKRKLGVLCDLAVRNYSTA